MYYRVDYNIALLIAGALAAALSSRRLAALDPGRLARGYLGLVSVLVAIRAALFVATWGLGMQHAQLAGALVGDLGTVVFGAIYGWAIIAWTRGGFAGFLRAPETRFALGLPISAGFALSALGKTFGLDGMLTFFAQSGYTKSFLFFIIALEVICAIALLLPWRWVVVAAIGGLAVDMIGAITTHVHNGDPLDDSTGAIAALLRIAPLALLYVPRRWVAVGAAACAATAVAGAAMVRQPPAPPPPDDELAYFAGVWHCAGQFDRTGKPIEADLHGELAVPNRWLTLHHDDRAPASYHAVGAWFHDGSQWTASLVDSSGGVRRFRSDGWRGDELRWDRSDTADDRFTYRRLDAASFEVSYDRRVADAWQRVDTLTCHRD